MKHEIITLENVQIIGMAKEIAFCKGQEECPKPFSRQPSTMVSESLGSAPATLPTIIVQPVGRQTLVLAARTPLHTSSAEYIKVVGCLRECSFSLFIVASG